MILISINLRIYCQCYLLAIERIDELRAARNKQYLVKESNRNYNNNKNNKEGENLKDTNRFFKNNCDSTNIIIKIKIIIKVILKTFKIIKSSI